MIRPEDEPKINRMTVALKLSKERACILLVSYNDELLRREVEAELKRRLAPAGFRFPEIHMKEEEYKNLPVQLRYLKPQPEDIFLIFDLRKALPEVLEYLNYRREDFVEYKISAIFWLDEPTLTEIARKAPDFWAFRDRTFEFNVDSDRDIAIPGRTILSEIFAYDSLEELDSKIALREELLKDYLEKGSQDCSTIAGLHSDLGVLYYSKSQFGEAMVHYREALNLYRLTGDKRGEAAALGNMGSVYRDKGDLDNALECSSQALEIHRRLGDVQGEAFQLNNIGGVYHYGKRDLKGALEYVSQALTIYRRIGDAKGEANTLNNMGTIYMSIGDLDEALRYCSQSLEIHRKIGYARGEADTLNNIGLVHHGKGDLDKALEHLSQALNIHHRLGDIRGQANALSNIGFVYYSKGDLREALDRVKEALGTYISTGIVMSADISYRGLQEIMNRMETTGEELSEEDRKEIAQLTEEYDKLKSEPAGVSTP